MIFKSSFHWMSTAKLPTIQIEKDRQTVREKCRRRSRERRRDNPDQSKRKNFFDTTVALNSFPPATRNSAFSRPSVLDKKKGGPSQPLMIKGSMCGLKSRLPCNFETQVGMDFSGLCLVLKAPPDTCFCRRPITSNGYLSL